MAQRCWKRRTIKRMLWRAREEGLGWEWKNTHIQGEGRKGEGS